jgi:hypothetical protein
MTKTLYVIYTIIIATMMASVSYSPSSTQYSSPNSNSYYHGSSGWSGSSYGGSVGGGHK